MKKVKIRFYINHLKEEKWINEMTEQGWNLKKFWPFMFVFDKGDAGEYIYRYEMVIENKNEYFEFLQTKNVEYVHHFGVNSYFRKKRTDGPFEIYADPADSIRSLSKLNRTFIWLFLFNILVIILEVNSLLVDGELPNSILNGFTLNIPVAILVFMAFRQNSIRIKSLRKDQLLFKG